MAKWFVYMLSCSDNSIYTGITTDLKRRSVQHNNKKGAKALFGKLPVKLVFTEEHIDQTSAARREREIKGWKRVKKLELITGTSLRLH